MAVVRKKGKADLFITVTAGQRYVWVLVHHISLIPTHGGKSCMRLPSGQTS